LTKAFRSRIPKDAHLAFIELVKRVLHYDKNTKKLFRKAS
jgi:hypothetical protein